jgi:hypothetical protein
VPERAGRGFDAGIAVVRVHAEASGRRTELLDILAAEDAEILQDHVLDHAAMPLGHDERVDGRIVGIAAHQAVIGAIDDLGARIGRADVQRRYLQRHVENAPAKRRASHPRRSRIERVPPDHLIHHKLF